MTSLVGGQAEDYLRHLVVERGLSDNTVQAYRRDLLRYQEYLGSRGIGSLAEVTRVDVEEFRRHLDHIGLAPRVCDALCGCSTKSAPFRGGIRSSQDRRYRWDLPGNSFPPAPKSLDDGAS